jgi:hypothetical protein
MSIRILLPAILAFTVLFSGCTTTVVNRDPASELVGAWIVTSSRTTGVGKNLLTFSSDGTFFRSGDTHPTLSGGHGTWRRAADGQFEATYIAFRFDETGKWVGSAKTRLRIKPGPGPNEFTGTALSSTRDLDDKEIRTGESRLQGKRIEVEAM